MNKYLSLLLIVFLVACGKSEKIKPSGETEEEINPVPENEFISDDKIITYFKNQLDKENIVSPEEQMFREFIKQENIKNIQAKIWKLWKQANQERIQKSNVEATSKGVLTIWDIPQNERMRIKLFLKGNKPNSKYPMIFHLHGGGSFPNESGPWASSINEDEWYNSIILAREYDDAPVFYFIPRMSDDRKGRWYFYPQIKTIQKAIQIAVLSDIANPSRVYVTGISEGGYGTLRLARFMPDYFAAAGAVAAADRVSKEIINLRNLAFFVKVGENDSNYGRNIYAYKWQNKLKELNEKNPGEFINKVVIQKNAGHFVDYMKTTPWLIKHERTVYPKHVSYVYHNIAPEASEISGAYSKGVYFLDFRGLTRKSNKDMALFDVVRNGNEFDITFDNIQGNIKGKLSLFINDEVDFNAPIKIKLNGKSVYSKKHSPSRGTMVESIALWGDPLRIFLSKVTIDISTEL